MRQWAPGAQEMWLMGDFNNWKKFENPFCRLEYGKWEIKLGPNGQGTKYLHDISWQKLISSFYISLIQGNLLKGIVIWFVRRESIEPIKRVFSNVLFSVHFL